MQTLEASDGWRLRVGLTVIALALLAPAVKAIAGDHVQLVKSSGAFHADCASSHFAPDDPIVFPRQAGASHLHQFFGNKQTRASTTAAALRRRTATTCVRDDELAGGKRADGSAYWVPALLVGDRRIPATQVGAYYSAGPRRVRRIKPFPPRLRMIAGDASGHAPLRIGARHVYLWRCGGKKLLPATDTAVPTCATPDLRLDITFPDCWDGRRPDSRDHKSHMAYSQPRGKRMACPRSHPVAMPILKLGLRYPVTGGPNVKLTSGPVTTAHADFMNGWNQRELAKLVKRCLKTDKYCGGTDRPVPGHE